MPVYTQQIGRHELGNEDNVVYVRYHGPIVGIEMTAIMEFISTIAADRGPVYVLIDANDTSWPDVDARRVMSTYGYKDFAAMARYQRIPQAVPLTALLQNAARLLGRPTTRAAVFTTETEARDWLMGLRAGASR
jgi:hypothetical protein